MKYVSDFQTIVQKSYGRREDLFGPCLAQSLSSTYCAAWD